MLCGLGRSAVDISTETFLKITSDRADVNVHVAWQFVGCKLLANVILFCVWELSASRCWILYVFSFVSTRMWSPFANLFQKLSLHMQSSLAVNSQYAVSHGGHVVVGIMFILPYWSTKILPSHSGNIQRHFKQTHRKILTFSLLQKYLITLSAMRWANATSMNAILRKRKRITLKSITKSSQEFLFSSLWTDLAIFFYLCCTSFILFILQKMQFQFVGTCVLVILCFFFRRMKEKQV